MSESRVVEIYEVEYLQSGKWVPDPNTPWTSKDNMPSRPADELQLPSPEWKWESNWRISKRPGGTDKDGWEFASRVERFSDPSRKPKPEKLWNDKSRRRMYSRVMRRDSRVGKAAQFIDSMPKIQKGLRSIYTVRVRIEQVVKQAPEAIHEPQMIRLVDTVRQNMLETLNTLNTLDSTGLTSAQVAVIKKLRNDLQREETAIEKAVEGSACAKSSASTGPSMPPRGQSFVGPSVNDTRPPTGPSMTRGHSFAGNSSGGSGTGTQQRSPNPSRHPRSSGAATTASQAKQQSQLSGSMPSRTGAFMGGGDSGGGSSGYGSASGSGGGGLGKSSSSGVISGGKGVPLNLSFSGAGSGLSAGGEDDGMFVQRPEHELEILQKLKPINQVEVNASIIEERAVAIEEIHKGLVEVNEMFNDLSKIIKEQQGEVDTIFNNCDESHAKTAEAFAQIVEADRLQQESCVIC